MNLIFIFQLLGISFIFATKPSCLATATATVIGDPNTICTDGGKTGSFSIDDDTCTQYIVCYKLDQNSPQINGVLLVCKSEPAQLYFDPILGVCTSIQPESCAIRGKPTTIGRSNNPPRDANTICTDAGDIGNFPTEDDTTCTKFVVCYKPNKNENIIKAVAGKCPSQPLQQYFDPVLKYCTNIKPETCFIIITTTEDTTTVELTTYTTVEASSAAVDRTTTTAIVEPTTAIEWLTERNPPRDANTICAQAGVVGNFPTEDDSTCTKYIICYQPIKGVDIFNGILSNCPSQPVQQYFDTVFKYCTQIRPENCNPITTTTEDTTTVELRTSTLEDRTTTTENEPTTTTEERSTTAEIEPTTTTEERTSTTENEPTTTPVEGTAITENGPTTTAWSTTTKSEDESINDTDATTQITTMITATTRNYTSTPEYMTEGTTLAKTTVDDTITTPILNCPRDPLIYCANKMEGYNYIYESMSISISIYF